MSATPEVVARALAAHDDIDRALQALPDIGMEPRPAVRQQLAARRRLFEAIRRDLWRRPKAGRLPLPRRKVRKFGTDPCNFGSHGPYLMANCSDPALARRLP